MPDLVIGDARWIPLRTGSVHMCVTSPPYWSLRNYGMQDQLGAEPSPDLYIENMVFVFHEVRRVLRDDGSLWLVLGETFARNAKKGQHKPGDSGKQAYIYDRGGGKASSMLATVNKEGQRSFATNLPLHEQDLIGIPWRVAFALVADGWHLRGCVVWNKPNCMPSSVIGWRWEKHRIKVSCGRYDSPTKQSVTRLSSGFNERYSRKEGWAAQWTECPGCEKCLPNAGYVLRRGSGRPTVAHEYIFMLTKTGKYFYDSEAVREPDSGTDHKRNLDKNAIPQAPGQAPHRGIRTSLGRNGMGRNLRSVWTFPTQPFKGTHFATFPELIPEICILASTSEKGCCPECGAPWVRVVERTGHQNIRKESRTPGSNTQTKSTGWARLTVGTGKFMPSCKCAHEETVPCLVLDPFLGSGTTCLVAESLGRKGIGIDIGYQEMARQRILKGRKK